MTNGRYPSPPLRTIRLTGLAYLAMAICGAISYFVVRPKLFVAGDASATMLRLVEHETLARLGLVASLGLATSAAATALMFFVLFRKVDSNVAISLTTFLCMSAVIGVVGMVFSAAGLNVAVDAVATNQDAADNALLLIELSEMAWSMNALFFGLWLLPMGWLVLRSGWMPRLLGWALLIGGVGYVASAVLDQLQPESSTLVETLTMPASIAEFSMIIYLLTRRTAPNQTEASPGHGQQRADRVAASSS